MKRAHVRIGIVGTGPASLYFALLMKRRQADYDIRVIECEGQSEIDGETLAWGESDTLAVLTHARVVHRNGSNNKPACLFHVDDAPLQRKIGIYEELPGA
jgi:gentisate 1,2-dioxygenase